MLSRWAVPVSQEMGRGAQGWCGPGLACPCLCVGLQTTPLRWTQGLAIGGLLLEGKVLLPTPSLGPGSVPCRERTLSEAAPDPSARQRGTEPWTGPPAVSWGPSQPLGVLALPTLSVKNKTTVPRAEPHVTKRRPSYSLALPETEPGVSQPIRRHQIRALGHAPHAPAPLKGDGLARPACVCLVLLSAKVGVPFPTGCWGLGPFDIWGTRTF